MTRITCRHEHRRRGGPTRRSPYDDEQGPCSHTGDNRGLQRASGLSIEETVQDTRRGQDTECSNKMRIEEPLDAQVLMMYAAPGGAGKGGTSAGGRREVAEGA